MSSMVYPIGPWTGGIYDHKWSIPDPAQPLASVFALSTIVTRRSRFSAAFIAAMHPASPPPTTSTSVSTLITLIAFMEYLLLPGRLLRRTRFGRAGFEAAAHFKRSREGDRAAVLARTQGHATTAIPAFIRVSL